MFKILVLIVSCLHDSQMENVIVQRTKTKTILTDLIRQM